LRPKQKAIVDKNIGQMGGRRVCGYIVTSGYISLVGAWHFDTLKKMAGGLRGHFEST